MLGFCATPAFGQAHDMAHMAAPSPGWTFRFDAQAFLTANLQERKFTSFHQVESQNWFMAMGTRTVGRARVTLDGMFSLEPITFRKIGSAEAFQVGETFDRRPLIDYQHPHDVFMSLGARIDWPVGPSAHLLFHAAAVGEPALGPAPFMHRASAEANPTAPLGHHHLDSTHITHGVVTAGASLGALTIETSRFRGREPDENRWNLEMGSLDSYSARLSWRHAGWHAQVSGGKLTQPDPTEFGDTVRLTASVDFTGEWRGRPIAWLVAWGRNHERGVGVTSPAWLVEGAWHRSPIDLVFARVEIVDQDILTAGGYDPPGFVHPHELSRVGAVTVGYERNLAATRAGQFFVGADVTGYRTPSNLIESYGHPVSLHVFLQYRVSRP
jgi:hypothetical protein